MKPKKPSRSPRRRAAAMAMVIAMAGLARNASAQSPVADLPSPGVPPPPSTGNIETLGKRDFWAAGRERWFLQASGEAGAIYGRVTAGAGYGRPHWYWGGGEVQSSLATGGGSVYAGLHFAAPWLDVRAGVRDLFATSQYFLAPRSTYTKDDTEDRSGPKQNYVNLEAEAASSVHIGRGALFGLAGIYDVISTKPGWNLMEQTLQVVAKPGLLWRGRLGYLVSVDRWDMFRVGLAVEVIGHPARDLTVVRTGPLITAFITHHLEAYGTALLVIYSKDQLGLAGAQTGQIGFRYRWATGDRWPEFP